MSRQPSRRRATSLRLQSILGLFALGILALPFVIFSMGRLAFAGKSSSADPLARGIAVSMAAQSAVEVQPGARLAKAERPSVPEWLEMAIMDKAGRVVFSTFPGLEEGSAVDTSMLHLYGADARQGWRFMREALSDGADPVGFLIARFPSNPLALTANPGLPFAVAMLLLGLALAAFSLGAVMATSLARSFGALTRAASRIASGDLDGPISAKGAREIVSLAMTMDSMRAALLEDRSARARFLAGISHDLRTPLTSLRGYLEALEDGVAADQETRERWFRIMRDKTSVLEDRITELLSFARMQTGEWRLRLLPLDPGPFIEALCTRFSAEARACGRSFSADAAAARGRVVMADLKLLERALENLFSNALRYAPAGQGISLSCSVKDGWLETSMDDPGPGIPPEDLERIFEPYYRGDSAKGEGEGLGLSIARSILRDHGGDILAENREGGGCRFRASLPLSEK